MLSRILKEFRKTEETINLNEISRILGIVPDAPEGMIGLLVQQGKLKEVSTGGLPCASCAECHGCITAQDCVTQGKTWELVTLSSTKPW